MNASPGTRRPEAAGSVIGTDTALAPLAVVTGASSGIGWELARVFAEEGFDLVLCAEDDRIHARVDDLTNESRWIRGVQADLSTRQGVESLLRAVREVDVLPDAVAINAGVGNAGPFVETPLAEDLALVALNVMSAVHLAKELIPPMVRRGHGRILFTASVAGTMPGPYYATYAASKAFLISFAEAIRYELRDTGVTVTALLPGPTDTEFFDPARVARDGYDALIAGKDRVVAGSARNRAQDVGTRLLNDRAKAALHAGQTRPHDE